MKKATRGILTLIFLMVNLFVFVCLCWIYCYFLDWFTHIKAIKQIVYMGIIGSLAWLVSNGINIYLLELASYWKVRTTISRSLVTITLFSTSLILAHHLVTQTFTSGVSVLGILFSGVFFLEVTFYPLLKLTNMPKMLKVKIWND